MKNKLLALNLPGKVVDEILNVFNIYQVCCEQNSKPAGPVEFKENIEEIKKLSDKLHEKLKGITGFERQMLDTFPTLNTRELAGNIHLLSMACAMAQKRDVKKPLHRREPFIKQLAIEVKEVLENNDIPVTVYKNNVFCSILDILLKQKAGDKSFNLLRQIP